MSRQDEINILLQKLKEKEIFEIHKELEDFLQKDDDAYTSELQTAISKKLDNVPFPYRDFETFMAEFYKNNQTDPAGWHDFHNRIYGHV